MCTEVIEETVRQLKSDGYSGLYFEGECGCTIDDLAPRGECAREAREDFINGCEPGFAFIDPRTNSSSDFLIKRENIAPSLEDWEQWDQELSI